MYRQSEEFLSNWYIKRNRKPLVIRGARQVGKSTLVRQFCKKNNLNLLEINLELFPEMNEVFASKKIDKIIDALQDILEKKILENSNTVLFLDEIQAQPAALASLRYFFEDKPWLPVIAAGSLLEFLLNEHTYSMPVGRIEFLHLGPMNFHEFLLAKNESHFLEKISTLTDLKLINTNFHEKGIALVQEFMFVGGMPEAVKTLIEDSIEKVPEIHSQILQTYQSDFVKYARKTHLQKIQKAFKFAFLNPLKKIKYSKVSPDDSARDLKYNFELLEMAKVIYSVKHTNCSGLPLEATVNEKVFKYLVLDVGLMNSQQNLKWTTFKKINENEIITQGCIAEQFIGQHLLYHNPIYAEPKLNYWLREGKSNNAEVDYILEHDGQLVAFEVKAGAAGKIRSLHQWQYDIKIKNKKSVRFNMSKGDLENVNYQIENKKLSYQLVTLPLYMVDQWTRFI